MINIYEQLNRNLYLITSLENEGSEVTMSAKEIQSYNELFSESLTSGELYGDFSLKDGILQSSNFVTGVSGWQLTPTSSEFPSITVSGGTIKYQKTDFTDTVDAGYHISSSGFYFGSANDASYMKYNISTSDFDYVGNLSGRASSILAGAINASGDLVNDVINARLDSSSKQILSDFNFGSTNYAGAVKSGDITWNTTTGAITGGSGVVVYRGGIIAANAGVATITLDATTGSATFAGTLSAPDGTLGTITAGTITGGTIDGVTITGGTVQSASSGTRFVMTNATQRFETINANGNIVGTMNWSSTTAAILKLAPTYDARRALEIIIPTSFAGAGVEDDAKAITIANAADSITIDITDGGLVGLYIAGCDTSAIVITNPSLNAATLDFTFNSSDYPIIQMEQSGASTNSYGIKITQGTAALKEGIYIDNNADSHLAEAIYIDRDANTTQNSAAVKIDSSNAGSGNPIGIDFSGTTQAVMKVEADAGSIGAYAGRIPIYIGTTLRYIAYYA